MTEYKVRVYEDKTEWFLNGLRHREDGPAVERTNGQKEWFLKGVHHRENGPAIEYANGDKSWYIEHINYTESEYTHKMVNNTIEIDGKKFSLDTVKEALKQYTKFK